MTMKQNSTRICITLGTRPEAIKLAPVIQQFRQCADFETHVVFTGQHRDMVRQVMGWFGLEAEWDLDIMQPDQTLTQVTTRSLQGLEKIFRKLRPRLVLVQGDTSTAFAAALAAYYQQIPVGHVEAGLRTDNLYSPFPEEANRRLISQLATLHFAPTQRAVESLHSSGVTGHIYLTGNTVIDALLSVLAQHPTCDIPGLDWTRYRVLLATVHRRENWGKPLGAIAESFLTLLETFPDTALLLPLHPNPTVRETLHARLNGHPRAFLTEPLDYPALIGAIQRCALLLTDSGGLQEEAPTLGKPVLVLRETTERPEAIAAGAARLVGTDPQRIVAAASELLGCQDAYDAMANAVNPFGDGKTSSRILEIVSNFLNAQP